MNPMDIEALAGKGAPLGPDTLCLPAIILAERLHGAAKSARLKAVGQSKS
jgi:hypothetical protein